MKTIFNQGTIVTPEWFNSQQSLTFTKEPGQELYDGENYQLTNESLTDADGNIKSDFYGWKDQFKVSILNGRVVRVAAGTVSNRYGYLINKGVQDITIPPNVTRYVYLNESGDVETDTQIPSAPSVPLARVVTNNSAVTSLGDHRPYYAVRPRPAVTKVLGGTGSEGSYSTPGDVAFTAGVYYFDQFTVNTGHTVTVGRFAKIFVAKDFVCNGTIIVLPSARGGNGAKTTTINGVNFGFFPGSGISGGGHDINGSHNWLESPRGSGGSSGSMTADVTSTGGASHFSKGGDGGGGLIVECARSIYINGAIYAEGENGKLPETIGANTLVSGSGGGSGGTVVLIAGVRVNINANATVSVKGGKGGDARRGAGCTAQANGGGGGGGGQINLISPEVTVHPNSTVDVSGGDQGRRDNGTTHRGQPSLGGGNGGGNGGNGGYGGGDLAFQLHNGQTGRLTIRLYEPVG